MKNLFIDGGNLLHRCYYVAQNSPLINERGQDVGQILYFLKNVKGLQEQFKADRIFVAWDIRDKDFVNFRQDAVEYKEHRDDDLRDDVHRCDGIIWKMCELLGITCVRANKLEADDIISWLCEEYDEDTNVIVSSDKDFLQLFKHYNNISIFSPVKQALITEGNLYQFTEGVDIKEFLVYRAIVGDSSDNIKGLFRYGPVRTRKFLKDLKNNLEALPKDDKEIVKRNMKIMDLRKGLEEYPDEVEFYESQNVENEQDFDKFFGISLKLGINSIVSQKSVWKNVFRKNDLTNNLNSLFFE